MMIFGEEKWWWELGNDLSKRDNDVMIMGGHRDDDVKGMCDKYCR